MLIEFSVANYRSFREKVTLSMVASSDDTLEGNTFAAPGKRGMRLLKSAALYGANASGKSNLLKALLTMHDLVRDSATWLQHGSSLPADPHRLDPATASQPSEFEIVLNTEAERYVYGFAIDGERVHREWLSAARLTGQRAAPRMLFERGADGSTVFGDSWRGERSHLVDRTRANALLLSAAVQFNNETAQPVFDCLVGAVQCIPPAPVRLPISNVAFTAVALSRLSVTTVSERIAEFVSAMDVPVERLEVVGDGNGIDLHSEAPVGGRPYTPPRLRASRGDRDRNETHFDVERDESKGTQQLITLALPWLSALRQGHLLLIDEFESSLHPHIARQLLKSLHANEGTAQLIFTTHDTNLLDPDLLRRDQIWFTERSPEGATSLYSLWDFKPRKGENFRKGYLNGRYGAVPFLGDWSFGAKEEAEPAAAG